MTTRRARRAAVTTLAVAVLTTGFTSPALASEDPTEATADLIADLAPVQGEVIEAPVVAGEVSVDFDEGTVAVPVDPDEPIVMDSDVVAGPALEVSLPEEADVKKADVAEDGTIVYEATDGGVDVAVQIMDDASARLQTVIPDAAAPHEYTYDLGLTGDVSAVFGEDGSVSFTAPDGSLVGGAAAPWAKDANGNDVPTRYRYENGALVQEVDFTEETAFPVVADPWLGKNLYSKVTWNRATEGIVINATPSTWGKAFTGPITFTAHRNEVNNRYSAGNMNSSQVNQLYCHLMGFPLSLPVYNLESWRPNVNYATSLIKYRCNP